MEFHSPAGKSSSVCVARMSPPPPIVSKPEVASGPEVTTMVFKSHTREGRSSAKSSEINIQPEIVVQAEVHIPETLGETLRHLAARPETETPETEMVLVTEVVSAQIAPPITAPAVSPSVGIC